MRRYVVMTSKPRGADIDSWPDGENYLARTVYEPEPQCIDTGLLDKSGNPIMAIDEMDPIGFVHR